MTLTITYPFVSANLQPRPMTAQQIWGVAGHVRDQIEPRRHIPRIDFDRLIPRTQSLNINGYELNTQWEFGRAVYDGDGRAALGVTEANSALPGVMLVGINSALIGDREDLKRSTLAHEFGHVLFDGPSMLRSLREPVHAKPTGFGKNARDQMNNKGQMDWHEFRANEFMGAFLVPRALLHRELVRQCIQLSLALVDGGEVHPVLRAKPDPIRTDVLLMNLAERFGVSPSFIEYRIRRYGLVAQ